MFAPSYDGYPPYQRRFLDSYDAFFRKAGLKWRIGLTSNSLEAIRRIVERGSLAAVLPLRAGRPPSTDVTMLQAPTSARLDSGAHEHCLVTGDSLDPALRRFLRDELLNILGAVE
jgi:DNA-binding transcriptional LysR family regulator